MMVLFIPVVGVIAYRKVLPRGLVVLVAMALIAAPLQNLLVFNQFWKLPISSDLWFVAGLTLTRSLPTLLLSLALLFYARAYLLAVGEAEQSEN